LPTGISDLVFGDGLDNPLQAHLETILRQQEVRQLEKRKTPAWVITCK
jgi:hypothetical protein